METSRKGSFSILQNLSVLPSNTDRLCDPERSSTGASEGCFNLDEDRTRRVSARFVQSFKLSNSKPFLELATRWLRTASEVAWSGSPAIRKPPRPIKETLLKEPTEAARATSCRFFWNVQNGFESAAFNVSMFQWSIAMERILQLHLSLA